MDGADWAAVDLAADGMQLWLFRGDDEVAALAAPVAGDPAAALRTMLHPLLSQGISLPVIAAGWPGVAPVRVPCPPARAVPCPFADPGIALLGLPGLRQDRPADLIGAAAATRIAGHLARHPGFDGVLCLPGRQTAWVHLSAGEVVSLRGFLSGELLSALSASPSEGMATGFAEALGESLSRPAGLAAGLSSVRALLATEALSPSEAHARMAGLLIGAELAAARPWWLGQPVTVIGTGWLADRYAEALEAQGTAPARADPGRALLDGFRAARRAVA